MVSGPAARYRQPVALRLRRVLALRSVQVAGDVAIAALVLVVSLIEIASGGSEWSGPVGLEVLLAFACAVPLVVRRSHPLAVLAVVGGASIASGLVVAPVQGPFETFVAFVIAAYSVGAHAAPRRAAGLLVVVTVAGLAMLGVAMQSNDGVDAGDWIPVLVWGWGAFLIGRVIRGNERRTAELGRLAAELAAERDARAHEAVVVERARIARELHDVIAHNVSVMGVQAMAAGRILADGQPEVRESLRTIEVTGRETIDEMRRMLGVLRRGDDELALAPQPGLRDLEALAAQVRAAGVEVDVRVEGSVRALPIGLDLSAYRIVQEAMTNALKHAAGGRVHVTIRYLADAVEVEVVDDGRGGATDVGAGGHGLVGMRERVAMYGGRLDAGKQTTGGWRIAAHLPVGAP